MVDKAIGLSNLKEDSASLSRRIKEIRISEKNKFYKLLNGILFDVETSSDYSKKEKAMVKIIIKYIQKRIDNL